MMAHPQLVKAQLPQTFLALFHLRQHLARHGAAILDSRSQARRSRAVPEREARSPGQRARSERLQAALANGGSGFALSDNIMLDMWQKWVFLCSAAALTCMMRATVGQIVRTQDGAALIMEAVADCTAAAQAAGFAPSQRFLEDLAKRLTDPDSPLAASMLRDIQGGKPTEADHIIGDMLSRTRATGRPATLLRAAYSHLQAYAAQR